MSSRARQAPSPSPTALPSRAAPPPSPPTCLPRTRRCGHPSSGPSHPRRTDRSPTRRARKAPSW
eukprot:scaffold46940_cov63-Phaeocystis_antarctica.AAC.3